MKGFNIYDMTFLTYFLIAGYIIYGITFVVLTLGLFSVAVMVRSTKD
ncbi:MAG: hypothetical protein ACXADH_02075 [Candidatus Kariarchaeaceae archaeon]